MGYLKTVHTQIKEEFTYPPTYTEGVMQATKYTAYALKEICYLPIYFAEMEVDTLLFLLSFPTEVTRVCFLHAPSVEAKQRIYRSICKLTLDVARVVATPTIAILTIHHFACALLGVIQIRAITSFFQIGYTITHLPRALCGQWIHDAPSESDFIAKGRENIPFPT